MSTEMWRQTHGVFPARTSTIIRQTRPSPPSRVRRPQRHSSRTTGADGPHHHESRVSTIAANLKPAPAIAICDERHAGTAIRTGRRRRRQEAKSSAKRVSPVPVRHAALRLGAQTDSRPKSYATNQINYRNDDATRRRLTKTNPRGADA